MTVDGRWSESEAFTTVSVSMAEMLKQTYDPLYGVNGQPMPRGDRWRGRARAMGISHGRVRRAAAWRRQWGERSILDVVLPRVDIFGNRH